MKKEYKYIKQKLDYSIMSDDELIRKWRNMSAFFNGIDKFVVYKEIENRNLIHKIKKGIFFDKKEFILLKIRDNSYLFDYKNYSVASITIMFFIISLILFIGYFFRGFEWYFFSIKFLLYIYVSLCALCFIAYCTNFVCITNKRVFKGGMFGIKSIYFDNKHIVCDIGRGVRKEDSWSLSRLRTDSNFEYEYIDAKDFRLIIWETDFQTVNEIFPTGIKEKYFEFYFPRRLDYLNHMAMEVIFELYNDKEKITSVFNHEYKFFEKNVQCLPVPCHEKSLWRCEIISHNNGEDEFICKFEVYRHQKGDTFNRRSNAEKFEIYIYTKTLYILVGHQKKIFDVKNDKLFLDKDFNIHFHINKDIFIRYDILINSNKFLYKYITKNITI